MQKKIIRVMTNDPDGRNLQLRVQATVEVILAIKPAMIRFPAFTKGSGSPKPLYARLTGTESSTAKIVSVESASKFINVEINPEGFEGDPARQIRFSMRPGMAVGRFREQVVFKTDSARMSTLKLFVMGEVIGNITVYPKHLPFGMIDPGREIRKTITLKSSGDAFDFKVLEVSSNVDGLTTELSTVTPGKEYQIEVVLPQGFSKTVLRGEVSIKTDDKEQETITVRVFGRAATQRRSAPVQPLGPVRRLDKGMPPVD